jgi:diguanylate cyclase (GGDEF)-like protein/PAS domain S-box-containing protein
MMFRSGEFTPPALWLNAIGGTLYWAAALWFALRHARDPAWDWLLFALLAGMLGTAGLLFDSSQLWDANWWWWHLLRVGAFAMAFVHIIATFYRWQTRISELNARLDESNRRMEEQLAELAAENSERREAERALRESEHRHRLLYNKTPAMLHSLDRDGRVVEVSNFWLERMGFARPEVVGRAIGDFLTAGSRERMTQELDRFLQVGTLRDLELAFVRRDGAVIDALVSAAAEYGDDGTIRRSVMVVTDVTDRKAREAEVEHLSYFDALTHLPNRRLLGERAQQAMAKARQKDASCAVIYLDLDRFKDINDTRGHDTGDALLLGVARRLQGCLREGDTLARLGGDEFAVLLPDADGETAARTAGRIQTALRDPIEAGDQGYQVAASMGVAIFPEHGEDLGELLKHADIAMFQAKSRGLDHLQFHPEQREAVQQRVQLETELRRAIEEQALQIHFQPQVCLSTFRVAGLESLVRWEHPERGTISPAVFIPLAEETGLIHTLGQQVLEAALAQARAWSDQGWGPPRVAVNLSAIELQAPEVVARIEETLNLYEVPGHQLELEITETAAMTDPEHNLRTLQALRELGVSIAIDDFGTGYSSFSYLERLPVDSLKIDRSFVGKIDEQAEDQGIIQTILALTRELDLGCVAEGVETPGQEAILRRVGCFMGQGFRYAPALPAAELNRRFPDLRFDGPAGNRPSS